MNIKNFKSYLKQRKFKKIILEKEGVLKVAFNTAFIELYPEAICLSNEQKDYLCLEKVNNIEVTENNWGTEIKITKEEAPTEICLWCV